jgi:molybdopterin/thiamine biosynthesis adenylyltransferase
MNNLSRLIADKTIVPKTNLNYKPQFFRLLNSEEKKQFEELIKTNNSIQIHDSINDQLTELIKINYVSQKITDADIPGLISKYLDNIPVLEFGVWVYYPWLNKAVHILDEEDFIKIRTNRNQHKITLEELNILRSKKIGIIGLSVGQSIASALTLERCCGEIRLADFDDIQLSNLNRINTSLYNLGVLKVIQIAREIAEVDPFIKVACFTEGITENNIDTFLLDNGKLDLLIEECDSIDIKILARIKAKQYQIPVVMDTNDRGMIDIERYDINADYPMLHGLLNGVALNNLKNASQEQKLEILLKFFSFNNGSARGRAALLELGQTLLAWPQLASSVFLGGAIVTDVSRRILLHHVHESGRYYIDIEGIIKSDETPSYTPPQLKELSADELKQITNEINVDENNLAEIPAQVVEKIVSDAGTAPSSGNDQPWKFILNKKSLFLFHEYSRSYSFGDYRNMASYISLGTALENAVLSAHHYGKEVSVKLFPKENDLRCIAAINFKAEKDASTETHAFDELYDFVHKRCTNRKIEPNDAADDKTLEILTAATESIEGAKVSFITDKEKLKILGNIISACDRIRIMNPRAHYEFFHREIRFNADELEAKRTGMDVDTLELPASAILALKTVSDDSVMKVLRNINGLKAFESVSIPNVVNAAAMGLVTMPAYNPENFVKGGRAVQRQWLKATQLGLAYHPMIIPIYLFPRILYGNNEGLTTTTAEELQRMREQFMRIFPGDEKRGEVFLFRIFKADEIKKRSIRLPLSEILYT